MIGRAVSSTRDVRDYIVDALRQELVGPSPGHPFVQVNGEEVLRQQDPPRYRYSAGILFPAGVTFSASLDASEEAAAIEAAVPIGEEGIDGEAAEAGIDDQPELESVAVEDRAPDTDGETSR